MAERFSCALASLAAGEPCYGTASQVRRWIMVEQPGGWGYDAVLDSRLPTEVAVALKAAGRRNQARVVMIRRHGRSAPERTVCFAAVTTPRVRWIERFEIEDPSRLTEIDWSPLRDLASVGGEPVEHPLYLVCTNGSHDPCCALFGRPVAQVLAGRYPQETWEVSHIGGDRFAGNVVCVPDGVYYGRVTPDNALSIIGGHERGAVDLVHYRGRSFHAFHVQAAEHLVREARGVTGLEEVRIRSVEPLSERTFRVGLDLPGESVVATVACSAAIDAQQLTCRSTSAEHPPRYRLADLERIGQG